MKFSNKSLNLPEKCQLRFSSYLSLSLFFLIISKNSIIQRATKVLFVSTLSNEWVVSMRSKSIVEQSTVYNSEKHKNVNDDDDEYFKQILDKIPCRSILIRNSKIYFLLWLIYSRWWHTLHLFTHDDYPIACSHSTREALMKARITLKECSSSSSERRKQCRNLSPKSAEMIFFSSSSAQSLSFCVDWSLISSSFSPFIFIFILIHFLFFRLPPPYANVLLIILNFLPNSIQHHHHHHHQRLVYVVVKIYLFNLLPLNRRCRSMSSSSDCQIDDFIH